MVRDVMPNLLQEIENHTALSLLSRIETYMESLLERLIEASTDHPAKIKELVLSNLLSEQTLKRKKTARSENKWLTLTRKRSRSASCATKARKNQSNEPLDE